MGRASAQTSETPPLLNWTPTVPVLDGRLRNKLNGWPPGLPELLLTEAINMPERWYYDASRALRPGEPHNRQENLALKTLYIPFCYNQRHEARILRTIVHEIG